MKSLGIACVFFAMAFTYPAKEVKLEYVFKVGDQYAWTQTSSQVVKQTIPGMGEAVANVNLLTAMDFKVVQLLPSGAKIEAVYTRYKMTTKAPMGMGDIELDSEGEASNTENKVVKAMMNQPFAFILNKQGIIEKVENVENLFSGLSSLGLDEATLNATKQQFNQVLGEAAMKNNLQLSLASYAANKVKVGSTWKVPGSFAMSFPVKVDNTWTLKSIDASVASLSADGVLTTIDKEQLTTLPNGMKSKFDMSGKQSVTCTSSVKQGWPSTLKMALEIKGNMTLLAGGMIPQDMVVPMEISGKSDFAIVKK